MTATPAMQLGPNHKYCPACATVLDARAPFCQKCGAPQQVTYGAPAGGKPKSKLAAALIAFFMGGIGGHRFYLGQWGWGILMLLTAWTFIPSIVALVDFIRYLVMSEEEFQRRYGHLGGGIVPVILVGAGGLVLMAILGILAAIAIPNFLRYQLRAKDAVTKVQLESFFKAQEAHRQATGAYLLPPSSPVPNDPPLGAEPMPWNAAEIEWAKELEWAVPGTSLAEFSIAVNDTESAASSFCAESDLDGDGRRAAWVIFRPHLDGGGSPEAPPPAPCSEDVVLSPEVGSLEYVDGLTKMGEAIRVSPPDVF